MKGYYIHTDKQEGPFSLEQLQQKKLTAETPVWHAGLNEWTTADKVNELAGLIKAIPPPFQTSAVSEYEYQLQMDEYFTESKSIDWISVLWVFVLIVCFLVLMWAMSR